MQTFDLTGKTAVVTGACGKLGQVWTKALLEAGANVAMLDKIEMDGIPEGRAKCYLADVTNRERIEEILEQIKKDFGPVTVLVNNAGIDSPPQNSKASYRLEDYPIQALRDIFEVNVIGAFLCMQVIGRQMMLNGGGSIINIGSLYASVSPDKRLYEHIECDPPFLKPPAYGASKAALYSLTKHFATHWAQFGVRVNLLSPGGVEGGQDPEFKRKFVARVPLGRMGVGEDLGSALIFLASDASRYITAENLKVDGGFTAW